MTKLYTPQSVLKTEISRKVLLWYTRFDMFVGFQSGGEAVLGREWFVAAHEWYKQQIREQPDNISLRYEERFAHSRLVANDTNLLFTTKAKGLMSDEVFLAKLAEMNERVADLEQRIDPCLLDPNGHVTDFSDAPPLGPDEIVNPYEPDVLWQGQQWTSNFLVLDILGIVFMYKIQSSFALRQPIESAEMVAKARQAAQIFQAVRLWPHSPPGVIFEAQASFAIGTLFLPKDPKHINWCRHTFAQIESAGCVAALLCFSCPLMGLCLRSLEHAEFSFGIEEQRMAHAV